MRDTERAMETEGRQQQNSPSPYQCKAPLYLCYSLFLFLSCFCQVNLNQLLWGYMTSPFFIFLFPLSLSIYFFFSLSPSFLHPSVFCCQSCFPSIHLFFPEWVVVLPGLLHSYAAVLWDAMSFYILNPLGHPHCRKPTTLRLFRFCK